MNTYSDESIVRIKERAAERERLRLLKLAHERVTIELQIWMATGLDSKNAHARYLGARSVFNVLDDDYNAHVDRGIERSKRELENVRRLMREHKEGLS